MGLDIFFFKVKKVRKSRMEPLRMTLKEVDDLNKERFKARFGRYAERTLKKLKAAEGTDEYGKVYGEVFPKGMKKFTQYDWRYQQFVDNVQPVEKVKEFFDRFKATCYVDEDAYFRKVNFIYHYFQERLENECCFVQKSDLEEIIGRCDEILKGLDFKKVCDDEIPYEKIALAQELLPTQSGFFFGSTDYDKWYFADVKDVRSQFKKLLRGFNEDTDVIYVVMSW